jgi:hypothetical protein
MARMRMHEGRVVRPGVALLVIAGLVVAGTLTGREAVGSSPSVGLPHRLALRGRAQGLYPGAVKPMRIVVRNRTDRDVRLVALARRVSEAPAGCPVSVLKVRRPRALPVVPAGGRVAVFVRVHLLRSAPDACQGAVFRVTLRAKGVPA